ncbi:MAG TPA: GNAT family N-acetyltransferase [Acidimicrobiales bacterium]|nr:GNAT family N-acetyltransferase [Acidimicrobiales bacterium]
MKSEINSRDDIAPSIRHAEARDADAVQALARQSYEQYVKAEGSEPAPMTADYANLIHRGHVWVAEQDDAIVGLLVLVPRDQFLLLDNIAVSERVRGLGVGASLLKWTEHVAVEMCLPEIRLYTGEVMTQNRYYYARHGYRETHRGFDDGHHRIYYTKELSSRV